MGSHVKRRGRQSLFFINVPSEKVGTQVRVCDFSVSFTDSMAHFQAFSTASCHVPYFSIVAASVKLVFFCIPTRTLKPKERPCTCRRKKRFLHLTKQTMGNQNHNIHAQLRKKKKVMKTLGFKPYIHKNRKCRCLISTNHTNDPRFEKEAWGNLSE